MTSCSLGGSVLMLGLLAFAACGGDDEQGNVEEASDTGGATGVGGGGGIDADAVMNLGGMPVEDVEVMTDRVGGEDGEESVPTTEVRHFDLAEDEYVLACQYPYDLAVLPDEFSGMQGNQMVFYVEILDQDGSPMPNVEVTGVGTGDTPAFTTGEDGTIAAFTDTINCYSIEVNHPAVMQDDAGFEWTETFRVFGRLAVSNGHCNAIPTVTARGQWECAQPDSSITLLNGNGDVWCNMSIEVNGTVINADDCVYNLYNYPPGDYEVIIGDETRTLTIPVAAEGNCAVAEETHMQWDL